MGRKPRRNKVGSTDVLEPQATSPVEGYQEIKCVPEFRLHTFCYKLCGLACARFCERYPKKVCPGCPCFENQDKGGDRCPEGMRTAVKC